MTISAIVVADSVEPSGSRLTTVLCRYPLIIHNEVMTHRDFSRNSASSRAIPFKKMRDDIQADPFVPMVWTKNQPGMQGYEEMNPSDARIAKYVWRYSLQDAMAGARKLDALGCHKQIVNRLLMPFMHITVLISSTRWSNFFGLRCIKRPSLTCDYSPAISGQPCATRCPLSSIMATGTCPSLARRAVSRSAID